MKDMASSRSWASLVEGLLKARYAAGEVFTIADAYLLIPQLLQERPEANNVEARVRDALQQLKHQNRVEFLAKRGTYRLRRQG